MQGAARPGDQNEFITFRTNDLVVATRDYNEVLRNSDSRDDAAAAAAGSKCNFQRMQRIQRGK